LQVVESFGCSLLMSVLHHHAHARPSALPHDGHGGRPVARHALRHADAPGVAAKIFNELPAYHQDRPCFDEGQAVRQAGIID